MSNTQETNLIPFDENVLKIIKQLMEGRVLELPDGLQIAMGDDYSIGFLVQLEDVKNGNIEEVITGDLTFKQFVELIRALDITYVFDENDEI
jgi:hypothetical protein